jgi:hypothetical protein
MIFAPFGFKQQVTSTPPPDPLPSGIIMYYDAGNPASYPGTGTTITDLSGNGYTATMNASNGYSSSDGGYWTSNGVDNVSITGGTLNQTLTNWTMWTSVYKTADGSYDGIMFSRRAPGSANGIAFFDATGRFNLLANNGTEITQPVGASNVVLNQWALVAGGVSSTSFFRQVYRAGTQYWETGSKSAGSSNFDFPIVLFEDKEPGQDRTMAGRIGVSIMWDRQLSQAEITQVNDYFKSRYGI